MTTSLTITYLDIQGQEHVKHIELDRDQVLVYNAAVNNADPTQPMELAITQGPQ